MLKACFIPLLYGFFALQEAWGFGSAKILGMQNEHARITQAALGCDSTFDPLTKPTPCFEPKTLSNLGGESSGAFPAVESPDNVVLHLSGGPPWWHCDLADFLSGGYPVSREQATGMLLQCRTWAQGVLDSGLQESDPLCKKPGAISYRCTGVVQRSHLMLDTDSKVDVSQPATFSLTSGCAFNGNAGRIKCEVLQQFGYALHVVQDFYSHANYVDYTESSLITWSNPPGLEYGALPIFWDLSRNNGQPPLPNQALATGCYPDNSCNSRITHADLNKDKATIDPRTGSVLDPITSRGSIIYAGVSNAERAIHMAIKQTRATWNELQQLIIRREGQLRGKRIICAIASDTPNECGVSKSAALGEAKLVMPQGEIPDATKIAPYAWMVKEYEKQAIESTAPRGIVKYNSSATTGMSLPSINCGNKSLHIQQGTPDDNRILTAYDLSVSNNISCSKATTKLKRYYLFNIGKIKKAPDIQCLVMSTDPDGNGEPNARIVCKNSDESVEMSFYPDCAMHSKQGDCGL